MSFDYDVIFIGTGHACWHGALTLRRAGKKVAMADEDVYGGTCTNYGCDAKILLDSPFELQDSLERYDGLCLENKPSVDWKSLMAYKKQQIGVLPAALGGLFANLGLDVLNGHAQFVDAHTLQVGEKCYTAEYIVIGAGQREAVPDIPGAELLRDSRDFLDIDEMPKRLVILGAGIISMEFASIALKLGSQVTIVVHGDKALRAYPQKYVQKLIAKMESEGCTFCWKQNLKSVEKTDDGLRLTTESGAVLDADYILNATGRVAKVDNLGLEALGIESSRKGIVVNEYLQTKVENIYASGDVIDKSVPKLTPTAAFESDYIAMHILGMLPGPIVYPVVPNLVFTLPRIAQVGVSVDEAEKHPDAYRVVNVPYGQSMLWLARNEADIDITFVLDNATNLLVGAAIYGSEAGPWIDFLTVVINKKLTLQDLAGMIFAFPTSTYGLVSTLMPLMIPPQA